MGLTDIVNTTVYNIKPIFLRDISHNTAMTTVEHRLVFELTKELKDNREDM